MKLPADAVSGAFTIGDQQFVLFAAFMLIPVQEHAKVGIVYRAAEVTSISTLDDDANPFEAETAYMRPQQLPANSLDDACAGLAEELQRLGDRILGHQAAIAAQPPGEVDPAEGCAGASGPTCCGGHHDPAEAAIDAAVDAGDAEALLAAADLETSTTHEAP